MKSLFSSFPNITLAEWKDKLVTDLKDVNFEDLSFINENEIKITPFYNPENQKGNNNLLFQNPNWEICSLIEVADSKTANQNALFALNNGASGLIFQFQNENDIDLSKLLKDINIQYIYVSFKIKQNISDFTSKLFSYLNDQNLKLKDIQLFIDYDPINSFLKSGKTLELEIANYCTYLQEEKRIQTISIDTTSYQNAGFNSTTQLALSLAHLNEYLNVLEENNLINQIKVINVSIAIATNFFEEIAKMRAARILFANLFKSYNVDLNLKISAETSDIYRTHLDKYNNILRDSISGMAAVIGGCDTLYIHDFDKSFQTNHAFSERISRNQQLIFKEESYFNYVADIASGSYYIETLTQEISNKAWSIFQEIEQEGGLIDYINTGKLLVQATKQAQSLIQEYKNGKRTLIGVNKHVNRLEKETSVIKEAINKSNLKKINIASALSI